MDESVTSDDELVVQTVRMPVTGGRELEARLRRPEGSPDPEIVAVVAPALGVRQEFYDSFAAHLVGRGVAVLTFDYRAIGASRGDAPVQDVPGDLVAWGREDVERVLAWIRGRPKFADVPLVYVGHSMGIPLLGLAEPRDAVDAVIAVAAPHAHWRHWTGLARLPVWLLSHVLLPFSSHMLGYFPGRTLGLGADLPKDVALQWARWARHRDYIVDEEGRPIREGFEELSVPLLAISSREDRLSPPPAVEALLELFARARIEHHVLEGADLGLSSLGHLDFFRDPPGPALWDEMVDWIEAVLRKEGGPDSGLRRG